MKFLIAFIFFVLFQIILNEQIESRSRERIPTNFPKFHLPVLKLEPKNQNFLIVDEKFLKESPNREIFKKLFKKYNEGLNEKQIKQILMKIHDKSFELDQSIKNTFWGQQIRKFNNQYVPEEVENEQNFTKWKRILALLRSINSQSYFSNDFKDEYPSQYLEIIDPPQ